MTRHSRSELRTLKTKAAEGLRVAQTNLNAIGIIRDPLPRNSKEYAVADRCWQVVKTTFDQQQAVVDSLASEQKEVGSYKSKKGQPAQNQPAAQ